MKRKRASIFLTLPIVLAFGATGCHHVAKAPATAANAPPAPQAAGTPLASFQSPSGKTYARTRIAPADNDEPVEMEPHALTAAARAAGADNYSGTARKAAKLSIASGDPQNYADLAAILDSLIPDAQMRAMNISKEANSGRLPQEQGAVIVKAYLYAASKESDNDFHCIVGSDPGQPTRFMNVEVSALPPSSWPSFATLTAARNEFKAFFTSSGDALPTSGYEKYDPPIPIQVTGSLFFDVDHVPPAVGPTGMKPQTAWEIHPVSDIQFEPVQP